MRSFITTNKIVLATIYYCLFASSTNSRANGFGNSGFVIQQQQQHYCKSPLQRGRMVSKTSSKTDVYMAPKGFGEKAPKRQKTVGQVDREQKSQKYDEIAATGGQEYRIYVRKFGSSDQSWFPAGSIAVPRGGQVTDAIYANEQGLKDSIVKLYPKLKGEESEFEFGYNLKIYPDDPIEVAFKGATSGTGKSTGPSIGNWISNLLSPVDNSGVVQQQQQQQPPSSN